jgi:pyridoxal phosphate enzyme (YggS family)
VNAEIAKANLDRVRARLAAALSRAGRAPDSCRLLAVSKNRTPAEVDALAACGVSDFGENRVQEAARKIPEVNSGIRWHMIGHLQRNKVRKAVGLFEVIHSVDSVRLLETLGAEAERAGRSLDVFLEVNVSGEEQKHGFRPDEVEAACGRAKKWPRLHLVGLMTMAPFVDDPETVRPVFRGLRGLRDRLNESDVPAEPLTELSMGMTQDYEVAAEEGATWVRVGTALFAVGPATP